MSYFGQLYYPCNTSQFTTIQDTTYSTGVVTNTQKGINITKKDNSEHEGLITLLQTVPSAPYSAIAKIIWNSPITVNGNLPSDPGPPEVRVGLCFTDGTTTSSKVKMHCMGNINGAFTAQTTTPGLTAPVTTFAIACGRQYSSYTTVSAGDKVSGYVPPVICNTVWFKLEDDGTNCIYSISSNGFSWKVLLTESNTSYFTATNVGILANPWGADADINIESWQIIV